ncbi:unnamed protein product, partial [marine sediment metagenome]
MPDNDKPKTSAEINALIKTFMKEQGVNWDPLKNTDVTTKVNGLYSQLALLKEKFETAEKLIAEQQPFVDARKAEEDKNKTELQKLTDQIIDLQGKLTTA